MHTAHFSPTATARHCPLSPRRQPAEGRNIRPLRQPVRANVAKGRTTGKTCLLPFGGKNTCESLRNTSRRKCSRACLAFLWGAVLLFTSQAASAQGFITAEQLFRQLPTSIFDNTPEPLTEDNKEMLLEKGYTTNWVIIAKDADSIFMEAMSAEEGTVNIRMFRGPHGGVVAMGARTADTCAAELWAYSERMGLVPYAGPADPLVTDFLPANTKLGPEITPTFRICLEDTMLEAKPLFWGESGLIDIPGTKRVLYSWNGTAFTKNSTVPLEKSNP